MLFFDTWSLSQSAESGKEKVKRLKRQTRQERRLPRKFGSWLFCPCLRPQVGGEADFGFPSSLTSFITVIICSVAVIMEVITPAPCLFHITTTAWERCHTIKQLARPVLYAAACTTKEAQTSRNKMVIFQTSDRNVAPFFLLLYFFFWAVVFTPYSLSKYFTKLECIMQFQWDLLESSLLVLLR